nr:hypothetical protein [Deltaproteobacteria bacterium]
AAAAVAVAVATIDAVAATKMAASPIATDSLVPQAMAAGLAWANECANDLRAQERGIVGAWPGTLREARSRVLANIPAARRAPLDSTALDLLARATYDAARRSWQAISEPDLEP